MSELKSEILFNRALMWLLFAGLARFIGASEVSFAIGVMMGVLNVIKSARAYAEVDS